MCKLVCTCKVYRNSKGYYAYKIQNDLPPHKTKVLIEQSIRALVKLYE